MEIFSSLVKAAVAPPTQTIQPAQPIQPLTPPAQGADAAAPSPAPAAFPAGPMSLNAGQQGQVDPAAIAQQEQQQQAVEQAAKDLKKTQDEVQELKAHEAEARAEVAKAQVETEKHKAQTEMLAEANRTREQLASEQAKHQAEQAKHHAEHAKLREDIVSSKEKAVQDHAKMIERAQQINSQPTVHSEYAKRIAKKVEALGSRAKIAFVFSKMAEAPAVPQPPYGWGNVMEGARSQRAGVSDVLKGTAHDVASGLGAGIRSGPTAISQSLQGVNNLFGGHTQRVAASANFRNAGNALSGVFGSSMKGFGSLFTTPGKMVGAQLPGIGQVSKGLWQTSIPGRVADSLSGAPEAAPKPAPAAPQPTPAKANPTTQAAAPPTPGAQMPGMPQSVVPHTTFGFQPPKPTGPDVSAVTRPSPAAGSIFNPVQLQAATPDQVAASKEKPTNLSNTLTPQPAPGAFQPNLASSDFGAQHQSFGSLNAAAPKDMDLGNGVHAQVRQGSPPAASTGPGTINGLTSEQRAHATPEQLRVADGDPVKNFQPQGTRQAGGGFVANPSNGLTGTTRDGRRVAVTPTPGAYGESGSKMIPPTAQEQEGQQQQAIARRDAHQQQINDNQYKEQVTQYAGSHLPETTTAAMGTRLFGPTPVRKAEAVPGAPNHGPMPTQKAVAVAGAPNHGQQHFKGASVFAELVKQAAGPSSPLPPVQIGPVVPGAKGSQPPAQPAPAPTPQPQAAPQSAPQAQPTPVQTSPQLAPMPPTPQAQMPAASQALAQRSNQALAQAKIDNEYNDNPAVKTMNVLHGIVNQDPDWWKNHIGDNIGGKVMDSAMHFGQNMTRELVTGGEAYGNKDYTGALAHGARFVGQAAQIPLLAYGGGALGAAGLGAKALGLGQAMLPDLGLGAATWGSDKIHSIDHPEENMDPAYGTAEYRVGDQHRSQEQVLAEEARRQGGRAGIGGGGRGAITPYDAQRLQTSGYFHQDAFGPGRYSELTKLQAPWAQTAAKLAPIFYPPVRQPSAVAEGSGAGHYDELLRALTPLLQNRSPYPAAGVV